MSVSEIDKEAIVSYAAIHCGLTVELIDNYPDYPSNDEMAEHLTKINLGYNPEKDKCYDWYKLARRKSGEIRKYWLACKLANNIGDINKIVFSMPFSCMPTPANKVFIVRFILSNFILVPFLALVNRNNSRVYYTIASIVIFFVMPLSKNVTIFPTF